MTKYQTLLTMFETGRNIAKVILGERDFKLMCSLFENKVMSREQIGRQFFNGASKQAVSRRLRKLVDLGLITRTSVIVGHGAISGYSLTPHGLAKIKPMLAYEVRTGSRLSECPLHDIALNDIRKAFEAKPTVQRYYTENVLQTSTDLQRDVKFRPFIELNSDAMVEVDTKVGVLNLAIEFDTTCKSKIRYLHKLNAYYGKRGIDGVLYVCASEHILNTLLKIDKEVSDRRRCHPRMYLSLYENVIGNREELTFTNANRYIFRVR